jgi:hypothetical protein
MKYQFYTTIIVQIQAQNRISVSHVIKFNKSRGMVCTNDIAEQVSFKKNFALLEVAIILWCSACEAPLCFIMLFSYTIGDIGTESVAIETWP